MPGSGPRKGKERDSTVGPDRGPCYETPSKRVSAVSLTRLEEGPQEWFTGEWVSLCETKI